MGLLLEAFAGGLAAGAQSMGDNIHEQIRAERQQAIDEARMKFADELSAKREIANEQRKRDTNTKDLASIRDMSDRRMATDSLKGLGDAGVGGSVDAETLAALRANPEALAAYRKAGATGLLNNSRQQIAETDAESALSIGRTDYADKYENVAKGERNDAKLDAQLAKEETRHQEEVKRQDLREKTQAEQFKMQMNRMMQSERLAAARADKSETNATIRAKQASLSDALKAYSDTGEKAMLKLASPDVQMNDDLKAHYQKIADDSLKNANIVANQLRTYASTGSFDLPETPARDKNAPSLDNIFGGKKDAPAKQAPAGLLNEPAKPKEKSSTQPWQRGSGLKDGRGINSLGKYGL